MRLIEPFPVLLRRVLASGEIRYIAVRYASALLVALEGLFFARLLGPEGFGSYALVQQIAVLLALSALGHPAGFIYSYFRPGEPTLSKDDGDDSNACDIERHRSIERFYPSCALVQYLGGVVVACVAGIWYPAAIPAACYYAIQIPNLIVEPMLRVRGRYALSGAGRGAAATGVLLLGGAYVTLAGPGVSTQQAIALMLGGSALGYGCFYLMVAKMDHWPLLPSRVVKVVINRQNWRHFATKILRPGIPLNASSALLTTQNNLPRFFLERFHPPAALGVFSLAWQLSQGAMVLLSSLNAVSSVEIGKQLETNSPSRVAAELRRQFLRTLVAGGGSFLFLVAASYVLSRTVYRDYPNLVLICVLLNIGYLLLNITGSVTAFLFYERRTVILNAGYGAALVASSAACWFIGSAGLWYGYQIAAVSAILIVLNLTFLWIIHRLATRHTRQPASAAEPALI